MTPVNRLSLQHWFKFNVVGAIGAAVQFLVLVALVRMLRFHYLWATAFSVEVAIIHNFCWHWAWTWADRRCGRQRALAVLMRFNLSNGLISLSGNLLCASVVTGFGHLDPVVASITALILCCLANFLVSDRLIFLNQKT
jgi:putative flippase GtrA